MTASAELPPAASLLWEPAPPELELVAGEVHAFAFFLDLPASRIRALEPGLAPDEAARAERFKFAIDRGRFIAGRAGMRALLAGYLKREPGQLVFRTDPGGKPRLAEINGQEGIRFNLSGSQGLGMFAVQSEREVGVDVERVRPVPDALGVAERVFTEQEQAGLRTRSGEVFDEVFFSLWTRKEALIKCLGRGLSDPMPSLSVVPIGTGAAERVTVDGPDAPALAWVSALPEPCPGFLAALASEEVPHRVRCFSWGGPGSSS